MQVQLKQIEGRRFRISARGIDVIVDDTVEAGGPGDGFRPTELLLAGLASCMAGTMLNFAMDQDIPVTSIDMDVDADEAKTPKRIGRITVTMEVGAEATDRQRASLERVASSCKIGRTLEIPPDVDVTFRVTR